MQTCVVVPAYNEEQSIGEVVKNLRAENYAVVVVDDGSGDRTYEVAKQAGATTLRHALNRGQGAALQTGISYALDQGAEVIVTFDADGQLDPREIAAVIAPLRAGQADVVLGSRFLKSSDSVPVFRKIILKLATVATRYYTRLRVTDTHNGFRALTAAAAQKLQIRHDGMAHASEILEQIAQHKLRYLEVPVSVAYTDYSLQKGQRLTGSVKIVWDLFIGRLTK